MRGAGARRTAARGARRAGGVATRPAARGTRFLGGGHAGMPRRRCGRFEPFDPFQQFEPFGHWRGRRWRCGRRLSSRRLVRTPCGARRSWGRRWGRGRKEGRQSVCLARRPGVVCRLSGLLRHGRAGAPFPGGTGAACGSTRGCRCPGRAIFARSLSSSPGPGRPGAASRRPRSTTLRGCSACPRTRGGAGGGRRAPIAVPGRCRRTRACLCRRLFRLGRGDRVARVRRGRSRETTCRRARRRAGRSPPRAACRRWSRTCLCARAPGRLPERW
mmetsp:Transcript_28241/g.67487  ORF Transcript_28241/g.67487 Transcript_28241/m.67487 type:complete len:273 (-) Transcript_28241:332-1150(-)